MKYLMFAFDIPHTLIADIISNEGYEINMFVTKFSKSDSIILLELETQELLQSIIELLSDQRFLLVKYNSAMYHNLIPNEFKGKELLDKLNGTIINQINIDDEINQEDNIDFTKINAENLVKMYNSFSKTKKEDYKNFLIENEMYELLNLIKNKKE